ncbi:hypothetical protein [Helicobacter zhangjianzhongii]|uniref:Uncharacterized protein n=1 Tax=Helicobacter zhangjianzhongii TaxID=2974574 RepID=A0ACC6FTB3_9HELI|nr:MULTISPECIES: hypothetical protein [unclassified Helicobacter]MDL0080456.1 hypothetical protein [Helicobacter sp. CPD2-1]MDL0082392.1 hypothetical protein [Helicobacter sp. XJK30-2]
MQKADSRNNAFLLVISSPRQALPPVIVSRFSGVAKQGEAAASLVIHKQQNPRIRVFTRISV